MGSNYEMMRDYLDRITALDFEGAMAYYAEDVVAHVAGDNPTSGEYHGKARFAEYLSLATSLVDKMRIEEHDLLASDDHAVVLSTMHVERGGNTMASNRVVVYHIDDGKISELWVVDVDQKAVDMFLS